MFVSCTGLARFLIKETGETIAVMPQELAWDSEGAGDGGMGPKLRHWATKEFYFPASGISLSATWELWEYPLGVEDHRQTNLSDGLEVLEDFDIRLAVDEQMAFAAVEKHYEQFGHAGRLPANVAREYLGKVLQASITLPVADDESVRCFVADVLFPGVGERVHSSSVQYSGEPQVSSKYSHESVTDATSQDQDSGLGAKGIGAKTKPLAVTSQSALPGEVLLFRDLAIRYDFRNPRLMGRLHLSWRLLKALVFDGRPYAISEAENYMRLLFWREYRLQQDAQCRKTLDDWLADGCEQSGPQHLVSALGQLKKGMIGTFMGSNSDSAVKLADAILLPASVVAVK